MTAHPKNTSQAFRLQAEYDGTEFRLHVSASAVKVLIPENVRTRRALIQQDLLVQIVRVFGAQYAPVLRQAMNEYFVKHPEILGPDGEPAGGLTKGNGQ